jgi:hypothetical protein
MSKKELTRKYELELLALPPLKLVLGDVPEPDPFRRHHSRVKSQKAISKEDIVQRIIAHLKKQL